MYMNFRFGLEFFLLELNFNIVFINIILLSMKFIIIKLLISLSEFIV